MEVSVKNQNKSIVIDGSNGSFFQMEHSDSRYNDGNYSSIGVIVERKSHVSKFNNRRCTLVTLSTGRECEVFSDWSAREISCLE